MDIHSSPPHAWIEDFKRQHGRAPRILHLDNVANNAYQTAKMLNNAGADCDVLCCFTFHAMACPEWDEAEYDGDLGDLNYPLWHRVNLHGYRRPRWFAQGPVRESIFYLLARRSGNTPLAALRWRQLARKLQTIAEIKNSPAQKPLVPRVKKSWLRDTLDYLGRVLGELFTSPGLFVKRLRQKLGLLGQADIAMLEQLNLALQQKRREAQLVSSVDQAVMARLARDARTLFPERDLAFGDDITGYFVDLPYFKKLFACYDIVEAYGSAPVWPYLANIKNYVAYEHGTLRDYVFGTGTNARLCLLAYARAAAVYLTNVDNYQNAQYITANTGAAIVCGLHGIDMARVIQKMEAARTGSGSRFGIPADVPVFYCPARHTWLAEEGVFLKGEDKLIRAAARLAQEGVCFKLVLAGWGNDIDKTKAIIAGYPVLAGHVVWQPPLGKNEFYATLQDVEAVADQFYLHSYGGIAFEALCAGRSVLISSAVPNDVVLRFFGQPLPYCGCDDEDDIYSALHMVACQPEKARTLGESGRAWVIKWHSEWMIVEKNCEAFAKCTLVPRT